MKHKIIKVTMLILLFNKCYCMADNCKTIYEKISFLEDICAEKHSCLTKVIVSSEIQQEIIIYTKKNEYLIETADNNEEEQYRNIYHSQHGQDKYVNEHFFKNKRNGTFVDIGANNGITQSNTYFFEKNLGWTGICIEPIPVIFNKLKNNRNCICIQGCLSNYEGMAKFLEFEISLVSGLIINMDPRHMERWGHLPHKIITVPCYLPMQIFNQYNIQHIDYLSIDTEGGEFEILSAIDFSSIDIDIIDVEVRWTDDTRIHKLLTSNGYSFIKRIGQDNFYKKIHKSIIYQN